MWALLHDRLSWSLIAEEHVSYLFCLCSQSTLLFVKKYIPTDTSFLERFSVPSAKPLSSELITSALRHNERFWFHSLCQPVCITTALPSSKSIILVFFVFECTMGALLYNATKTRKYKIVWRNLIKLECYGTIVSVVVEALKAQPVSPLSAWVAQTTNSIGLSCCLF